PLAQRGSISCAAVDDHAGVPLLRALRILRTTEPLLVQYADAGLRLGISLLRRLQVPAGGLAVILRDALPLLVEDRDVVLRRYVAGLRQRKPKRQRRCVLAPVIGGDAILVRSGDRLRAHEATEEKPPERARGAYAAGAMPGRP